VKRAGLVAVALGLAPSPAAQNDRVAVDFARDVLPILTRSCLACHRGDYTDSSGRLRKAKGGLRLDGKAWILKGGKEGAVVVARNAAQSPMYTRAVLPADHEDRMPADGDPLTQEQTEVIRRWIDGGASFGDWVGEVGPQAALAGAPADGVRQASVNARSLDLARIAEGLAPLPPATIQKASASRARVTPMWHGSALLRVEFTGQEDSVSDADIAALSPLEDHVAVCVLARTKITDAACAHLARMPRLVRLDLRDTRVTDAGVGKLKSLAELRVLNLFATDVSDASVAALAVMPKLEELRLWQTKVTASGLAKLQAAKPTLDVALAPELPTAAPPSDGQRRRRGN
jgi:hypothetical protein